jgi:hypothetical protein
MSTIMGMRRMPHGGTTHPQLSRPGNGYGRAQRPGPNRGLSPLRLDLHSIDRVVGLWAADVDLATAERQINVR